MAKTWTADLKPERRPLADLMPYARNARLHSDAQIDQLAASMREFGAVWPALVDEKNEIIAGHGRVMAAERNGWTDYPVIVAKGWTKRQIRAYRLADNQLALNSAWDVRLLAAELADLKDMRELAGFSEADLLALFKTAEPPDEFPESDETIETEHLCPRCGFRWSGGHRPEDEDDDEDEAEAEA